MLALLIIQFNHLKLIRIHYTLYELRPKRNILYYKQTFKVSNFGCLYSMYSTIHQRRLQIFLK